MLTKLFLYKTQWIKAIVHKFFVLCFPKVEINRYYRIAYGHNANLDNPQSLMEKIFWMELHCDVSQWTLCADKYRMRQYVVECGLGEHLPKLYAKWDKAKDVDFDSLPDCFVLKANNGCGTVKVVKDKRKENAEVIKKEMQQWLKIPFGYSGYQIHYVSIPPCIIAEELLSQDSETVAYSPHSLVDFKVWCINGTPEAILVTYERHNGRHYLDLYDTNWKRKKEYINFNKSFGFREEEIPQPSCLNKMLNMAQQLSTPFPEVRVDFYIVNGRPYIGELTFTAGMGNIKEEFFDILGEKVDLSKLKVIR